jgi:hypothetical protein
MKVTGTNTIECLQGERFAQVMSGFDFDTASQITIALYKAAEPTVALEWLKTASEDYPDAGVIEKRDSDGKMVFTIDTTSLTTGKYEIEARVDVPGVMAPIVKQRSEFLTIKPSRT